MAIFGKLDLKRKKCKKTLKMHVDNWMLGMNLVFKLTWQNNVRSIVDIEEKSQRNLNSRHGKVGEMSGNFVMSSLYEPCIKNVSCF